jgi:lysophospholipase L1-like esterase
VHDMKNKTQQRLATVAGCAFSFIFALVFCEILLRLAYPLYSNYNTEMWRYSKDIKVPLKKTGSGHEHRPNMLGNYYGVDIHTNSHGWRDREYSLSTDKYRVMVLGASIVMGWGVDLEKSFTKVLEKRLNDENWTKKPGKRGVEVINTGVGNYNTEMQVNSFFRKGYEFDPDHIILFSYVSDSEPTHPPVKPLLYKLMTSYLYAFVSDKWINLRAAKDPNWTFLNYYSKLNESNNPGRLMMESAVEKLATYCQEKGIELEIVMLPEMHQFKNYPFAAVHQAMRDIGKKNGVEVVDLLPFFLEEVPTSLWVSGQDPHPNVKGHAIIARGIYENLFSKGRPSFSMRPWPLGGHAAIPKY